MDTSLIAVPTRLKYILHALCVLTFVCSFASGASGRTSSKGADPSGDYRSSDRNKSGRGYTARKKNGKGSPTRSPSYKPSIQLDDPTEGTNSFPMVSPSTLTLAPITLQRDDDFHTSSSNDDVTVDDSNESANGQSDGKIHIYITF